MAGEEGLVIPTFGIDPEADDLVLPNLPAPAPTSAKPAPTPTRFDPEGKGPRQGMGFIENLLGTFGSGTIEGTLNQAEAGRLARGGIPLPETTAIDQGSGYVPELDVEQAKALRDEAQQAVFDQVAYDLAPTRITPSSVAGSIAGQVLAPSNLLGFGGETAARFLAGRGYGEAVQTGAKFGAQAAATSAATQEIRRESGAIDHFSLPETLLAGVAGSVLGAGTHVAGQAAGKVAGSVAEFVRNRATQRQALGVDLPREALPGAAAASEAEPAVMPAAVSEPAARTAPAEAALRAEEPAPGMPAAASDPAAPVSREQATGRGEPPPPTVEQQSATSPDQTAPTAPVAPAEAFEARSARLSAEREAMQASGADAAPETRDLYEALGSADSDRNADPAWAKRHVDEAPKVGRTDVADHIVEGAERRAVEAERTASQAVAAGTERDTPGTRYTSAVAQEDAQQARATAEAVRRQREAQAAPDRGVLDERSPNTASPEAAQAEPPPLKARTKADWTEIRAATAPDVPDWAPKIQSTFDELAHGFGIEPPRLSIAKPKFDDVPLFGANDRQGNILLSDALTEHHAVNNAVHEFGHEVQFRLYDQAPAETQDAIQAAFRAARERDAGNTSLNQLRPVTATRKLGDAGQRRSVKGVRTADDPIPADSAAGRYQHNFEEWFAEQVSRWVTTDARPAGVVDRFFSGIADAWRKIYAKVTGHTPLASEVKVFLDARWEGAEAVRVSREPAAAPAERPTAPKSPAAATTPARLSGQPAAAPREFVGEPVPGLGEHSVFVPSMGQIRVAPVVVEAAELRTSADAGFDRTLQPRQRDRAASQEQIRDIATNLEPERLGVSAEADRGAPIVGGDSMVESGNGRVLAIRRAYQQGGEAADRYRAWLVDQGIDVARYREPVLVRQRLTGLTAEERRGFTDAANRASTLSMSAPERAMADARLITPDSLDLIRNVNDLGATTNREFIRTFTARLPQAERGAMTTAEGGLSAEGVARARNAVLAKAYDHAGVLSRIAESTSDEVKSISNALVAAAPDWAKLRADIGRGAVRADVDLTGELLEAVTRTADLRAKGQKLDTFLDQRDAFDQLPRPVEAFMRMFYDERGRRAASAPVVGERLRAYAGEARKVLADQGLDLGMPAVSAAEIQAAAARRGQRAPAGDPALLFSRRQSTDPRQISFFDLVAEQLRSAEPASSSKRAGDASDFLRTLGTEMADRAGREGPQGGSVLDRLTGGLDAEVQARPTRDPIGTEAGTERPPTLAEQVEAEIRAAEGRTAAAPAEADSFTAQLARELQAEIDQTQRTLRARPDLLDTAETSVVEAATRLHGMPAERRVSIDELRASVPNLSTSEFERAVVDLHGRGVARVADGTVSLDHAGVRAAQEAVEQHVRTEAESIGRELFEESPEVLLRRKGAAAQTVEEPDQIRQGRPVEDQGTAPIEGDARPARLEEMAQRLASDFETVLRTGRVQPGARGQFNTTTGVARVRSLSDLDTTLHEIGHSVQQSPQTAALVDPVIARNRAELAPLGAGTGATGDAEAFAELFRLYATNRAYAERTYPGATADLERTLRAELPAQAASLDSLRADLDTLHRADSGAVVGSDVITPKPDGLFRRMLKLLGMDIGIAEADPSGTVFYTWRDALYARMVSTQHTIGKAQDALARLYRSNTGETLNLLPQDDAYIRARLASGSRSVADSILARGVRAARGVDNEGPSYRDAVVTAVGKRWTPEQWHDFGAYLTARSMVADYERFAAGEIPNPPGKLSAGDYAKAVQELEARYPTFADGAEQLYTFQTKLLQRHFDLGLFTKDYYDAAMARRDYVPKIRDMEDLGQSRPAGSGKRDGASVMKAFRGSQRSVMNPLDAIYARVHELETAAALNETKVALARLAETAGPGSGFIAEPVPANKLSSVRVDVVDALRAAGSRANVDNLDLGALIHQAEGLLGDDVFSHIFRQEPIRPGTEPITFYLVNGERRALRLADGKFGQALYNALNTVTEPERNVFVSVLQIGQQMLRSGVTKSLGFIYRNPVRDQFTSVATGGRAYIPFYSAFKGLYDIASHGGDFERYLGFGGFGGGAIHEAIESSALKPGGPQSFRAKAWWDPTQPLGAAARAAELSEAATRAGLFQSYSKQAQGLGYDPFNSALYSTFNANDYIDFRRTGSDMAVVRRFVPFLGATIQGTDKEARSLIGDMVRLEAKRFRGEELSVAENDKLQNARAAWVKTLGLGLVMGGGTAYLNAQDPEWFGAAAWRRHRAYNITPAGPEGNWLDAPKPFGIVRNVSDTFEYGVEYLFRQDPTLLKKWGEALADAHSVPYTNPFIDVFYNARANHDAFRDRPIVPPSLQSLPAPEQYNRYTSEISKAIGQVTGWSPMKTDYVAKSLGGGTVIDWLRNSDTLIRWMQGKPGGKEKTIFDLPLARELVQNLAVGSEATTRFYNLVGQKVGTLEQAASAYGQKIATGDRTGAETYLRNLPSNERAYAVLMKTTFDAEDRLMHPLVLARGYNAVISGVSKALGDGNLLPEGDLDRQHITLARRDGQPIRTDGPTTEKLRNALDALSMVTARNALIAYGAEGMQKVPVADPAEYLDRIRMLSPEVARELRGRLAAKRLYDPSEVAERWPEVKARLLKDGEGAEFNDLLPHRARSARRERKRALADD